MRELGVVQDGMRDITRVEEGPSGRERRGRGFAGGGGIGSARSGVAYDG